MHAVPRLSRFSLTILAFALGVGMGLPLPAESETITLQEGEIAIIIGGKDPSKKKNEQQTQIVRKVYDEYGKQLEACVLCPPGTNVDACRKLGSIGGKKLCAGTIDATLQQILQLSVTSTRTTHSPDTCYREICAGGDCWVERWTC